MGNQCHRIKGKKFIKTGLEEKDFYSVLWEYFSLHASQRIQVFNFYVTLETCLVASFFIVAQLSGNQTIYKVAISGSMVMFSFVFALLDSRTKTMIKAVEESLRQVEGKYMKYFDANFMIFSREKSDTDSFRKKCCLRNLQSYSKLFRLLYLLFAVLGIAGILMACGIFTHETAG